MYVNTKHLRTLLYNVLLWTPGKGDAKKYVSQGLVRMNYGSGNLSFLSTDGYVVVVSGNDISGEKEVFFRGEDIKLLHRELPDDVEEINIDSEGDRWFFGKQEVAAQQCNDDQFWSAIDKIATSTTEDVDLTVFKEFYIDNRRLQKFSLVEPRLTYPLAFALRQTEFEQPVLAWKYGPDLYGIFSPLQVEAIVEAYPDDLEDVMW